MESVIFGPTTSSPLTPTLSHTHQGRGGNGGILSLEERRSEIATLSRQGGIARNDALRIFDAFVIATL
jgi:hypothetical protein